MVSIMDVEPSNEICDNCPMLSQTRPIDIEIQSADIQVIPLKGAAADSNVLKKSMKLELSSPASLEQIEIRLKNDNSTSSENENCSANAEKNDSESGQASSDEDENAKNNNAEFRSPMSPRSPSTQARYGSRMIPHQNSLTSTVDVVDDRKALRDALYQGIFHRHRRTIFAMGSFLRMLKSKNSQYNSIRSSSEGEGEEDSTR